MSHPFSHRPLTAAILLALAASPVAYAAEGDAAGDVFQLNTQTAGDQAIIWTTGDVAMDANGDFVAVWADYYGYDGDGEGVYMRRFDANGNALDASDRLVNTQTTGPQDPSGVAAAPDGRFVVVFRDVSTTNKDIYARLYGADGSAAGDPFQVNTIDARAYYPDVAMAADGSFVVVWNTSAGVMARRFSADGTALDATEVTVNTTSGSYWADPAVAMDPAGNYLIVWTATSSFDGDIMARRFNADGTAIDSTDFAVDTTYSATQGYAEARLNSNGDFVVAWSEGASGGSGVYAKCFDSTRAVVKDRFGVIVNADYTYSDIGIPYVAMDAEGDFAITALDYGTAYGSADGDGYGSFMQRYDSSCNAQYAAPVNVGGPAGSDGAGAIAMDADGDTVVAFTNQDGDDGDGYGVFAQRYEGKSHTVDLGLAVGDDAGGSLTPGDALTYTFTVTNSGSGTALGLSLTDALPTGLSYTSFSSADNWSCSDASGTVTCTLPNLAAGASSSVDVTVDTSAVAVHSLDNSASVTNGATDADTTDNDATISTITTYNVAPTFDATPSISGTAVVGSALSVTDTATTDLNGDSVTLSYQWQADGTDISGATASSYTLTSGEAHKTVTVVVTASDGYGGSTSATTAGVALANSFPTFDATPGISGTASAGETLTLTNTAATDADGDTVTLGYQWQLDGAAISGATSDNYTVQDGDAGSDITVIVTAADGNGGSTTASVTVAAADGSSSGGGGAFGWFGLLLGLLGLRSRARQG